MQQPGIPHSNFLPYPPIPTSNSRSFR
ncbi:unnamed protein product, partial [Rotaria sp. Silwood2]